MCHKQEGRTITFTDRQFSQAVALTYPYEQGGFQK